MHSGEFDSRWIELNDRIILAALRRWVFEMPRYDIGVQKSANMDSGRRAQF